MTRRFVVVVVDPHIRSFFDPRGHVHRMVVKAIVASRWVVVSDVRPPNRCAPFWGYSLFHLWEIRLTPAFDVVEVDEEGEDSVSSSLGGLVVAGVAIRVCSVVLTLV